MTSISLTSEAYTVYLSLVQRTQDSPYGSYRLGLLVDRSFSRYVRRLNKSIADLSRPTACLGD